MWFSETQESRWADEVIQDLHGVATTNDVGHYSVVLRYNCLFAEGRADERWEFLDEKGASLRINAMDFLRTLQRLVPLYQLDAVRDAAEQFSNRSSLWSSILKSVQVPDDQRIELERKIRELNQELLSKTPKIGRVSETLAALNRVIPRPDTEKVDVQALPVRLWDLLSRAQVVVGGTDGRLELPLRRHGQGTQSLAVIFLFKAYFAQEQEESEVPKEPLLTLEEPEAHLHPQAARLLWNEIDSLPGQVLVTSHSPYFAQYVPLECLRIVRKTATGTQVLFTVPSCEVWTEPGSQELERLCQGPPIAYDLATGRLQATRALRLDDYRTLVKRVPQQHHEPLKALRVASQAIVDADDRRQMNSALLRLRGEMLFSRVWLLVEGEGDRLILEILFQALGRDLDALSITLVDFQVGLGNPGSFGSLSKALGYATFLLCDGDKAGSDYKKSFLANAGAGEERVFIVAPDMEGYLLQQPETHACVREAAHRIGLDVDSATLTAELHGRNTRFPGELRAILAEGRIPFAVPAELAKFLESVCEVARG